MLFHFLDSFVKYIYYFLFIELCFVCLLLSPSLSQILPTKLKRITPLCQTLSEERPDKSREFVQYIKVVRLFAPGAHFLSIVVTYWVILFVAYRLVRVIAYCIVFLVAYRLVVTLVYSLVFTVNSLK